MNELEQLVDDIGQRSFDARLGRRGFPDSFDEELWRNLEDTGLSRLTSGQDAGPVELATVLAGLARHAAAVPIAETDLLAAWLAGEAGVAVPDTGPLTVAPAHAEDRDGRITGTAHDVPWPHAMKLMERLSGNPVLTLIKQGDHRLSSAEDLQRIEQALNGVLAGIGG